MLIADKELRLALKFVLTAVAAVLLVLFLARLMPIITIFVIALFITYCINPLVNILTRNKVPPLLAAVIASLIILIALFFFFYLLIPGLISELRELASFVTIEAITELPKLSMQLEALDERFNLELSSSFIDYFNQLSRQIPSQIQNLLRTVTNFLMAFISRLWIVLGLVFLVFYLVQDLEKAKRNLTLLFPQIYHQDVAHILGIIDQKVGAYIRGTLLKCLFVGLLTGLGLSLMGMPFALMLGILAGVLNIVLYVGPVMAAVPALLLSIYPDYPNFFLVLALYIFVQILDAFVFTPVFLGKAVDISPLTVVVVILIGGQLAGLLGIILSVPLAAIIKVLLSYYYLEKKKITG